MTVIHENPSPRTYRDLNRESRVRELASLQDELHRPEPITHLRLTDWASASTDRRALLKGAVWGGIHWPKGMGKPLAPSITAGFTVTHEFKRLDFVDVGGSDYRDRSTYVLQAAPSVWDATKDPSEYRVGFFFFAGGGGVNPNRLTVKLAPVAWEKVGQIVPGYRQLSPLRYSDFGNLGKWLVIPDFEVTHVPYPRSRYIQSMGVEPHPGGRLAAAL